MDFASANSDLLQGEDPPSGGIHLQVGHRDDQEPFLRGKWPRELSNHYVRQPLKEFKKSAYLYTTFYVLPPVRQHRNVRNVRLSKKVSHPSS